MMRIAGARGWVQKIFIVISVVLMIFIFSNSAQNGTDSGAMSNAVLAWIEGKLGIKLSSFIVRKAAHFLEFAALGFSLSYATACRYKYAVLIGIVYAASDELHQLFVPERACQFRDVCIDSCGIVFGVLAAFVIVRIVQAVQSRNTPFSTHNYG